MKTRSKHSSGGIIITTSNSSDLGQRIADTIKEGVDEKYLRVIKDLKNYFYLEDIAAAALQLSVEKGAAVGEEVRRRSLAPQSEFIPLKTKDTLMKAKGKQRHAAEPISGKVPWHNMPQRGPSRHGRPSGAQQRTGQQASAHQGKWGKTPSGKTPSHPGSHSGAPRSRSEHDRGHGQRRHHDLRGHQ